VGTTLPDAAGDPDAETAGTADGLAEGEGDGDGW
jgi:hypothetical protein